MVMVGGMTIPRMQRCDTPVRLKEGRWVHDDDGWMVLKEHEAEVETDASPYTSKTAS